MKLNRKMMALAAVCAVALGGMWAAEPPVMETLSKRVWQGIGFGAYGSIGGSGAATMDGELYPVLDMSSGFQILPWLALGGYYSYAPLSEMPFLDAGITIADRENAFSVASGTELILTPWAARLIHPYLRIVLGGKTVGYLVDDDTEEGFESSQTQRFFNAGLAVGTEVNLSVHSRFYLRVGGQFTGNECTMDIAPGALSGLEIGAGFRFVWRTILK